MLAAEGGSLTCKAGVYGEGRSQKSGPRLGERRSAAIAIDPSDPLRRIATHLGSDFL